MVGLSQIPIWITGTNLKIAAGLFTTSIGVTKVITFSVIEKDKKYLKYVKNYANSSLKDAKSFIHENLIINGTSALKNISTSIKTIYENKSEIRENIKEFIETTLDLSDSAENIKDLIKDTVHLEKIEDFQKNLENLSTSIENTGNLLSDVIEETIPDYLNNGSEWIYENIDHKEISKEAYEFVNSFSREPNSYLENIPKNISSLWDDKEEIYEFLKEIDLDTFKHVWNCTKSDMSEYCHVEDIEKDDLEISVITEEFEFVDFVENNVEDADNGLFTETESPKDEVVEVKGEIKINTGIADVSTSSEVGDGKKDADGYDAKGEKTITYSDGEGGEQKTIKINKSKTKNSALFKNFLNLLQTWGTKVKNLETWNYETIVNFTNEAHTRLKEMISKLNNQLLKSFQSVLGNILLVSSDLSEDAQKIIAESFVNLAEHGNPIGEMVEIKKDSSSHRICNGKIITADAYEFGWFSPTCETISKHLTPEYKKIKTQLSSLLPKLKQLNRKYKVAFNVSQKNKTHRINREKDLASSTFTNSLISSLIR